MTDETRFAETRPLAPAIDSQRREPSSSRKAAPHCEADLLQKLFWSVPESAFMCRVGVRTLWRLMADPKAGFPKARHVRGRTLLARDEVLAFLREGATR